MEIEGIKYYSEEELKQQLQVEGDRRVSSAQKKWQEELPNILATEKAKWERESQMTAEELAKKHIEEQSKLLEARENEVKFQANLLTAKEKLTVAGVPKDEYEKMLGILVNHDVEKTTTNVDQFIDVFTSTKSALENNIRTEFSKIPQPPSGGGSTEMTKSDFMKLSYAEKVKIKNENPELYSTLIR